MRFKKEDCVVLVVDIQEKLVPFISENEEIVKRSAVLLQGLDLLEVPILVTRQYPKGLGDTIASIKNCTENAPVLDKISFSCGEDEAILAAIKASGKKNIILCGVEAHVCVLQTAIDLQQNGFVVVMVTDCTGSRKAGDKEIALSRATAEGVYLATTESILFELTRTAAAPVFKEISKLIK